MPRCIVDHMAALAKRGELFEPAIAGVMMKVRAGQYYWRPSADCQDVLGRAANSAPLSVSPIETLCVPPAPIAKVEHPFVMPSSAMLAASLGPDKANEA